MKKDKGITLISLVVTIIVLIILAGVSINLILGKDGIITKAKQAKENMELATYEEQEQLNELYSQMTGESVGSTSNDAITKLTQFKKALADYIESKNVDRPEAAGDASVYINSFEEVLALASKVDESVAATSSDITKGKKAWVNGKLITGTGEDSSMQLPYYVYPGTKGYIYAYYVSSFTSAPAYGSDGLFGTYDLTGISKLNFKAVSFNTSYYTATIHVSLSDHIPTSLDDMKSSPVYSSFSARSETEFTLEIPSSLDKSKKYWLLFYSNSASNGYTSAGIKNVYFQ